MQASPISSPAATGGRCSLTLPGIRSAWPKLGRTCSASGSWPYLAGSLTGESVRLIPQVGSVEELDELFGGQACLPQDGGQGAALDRPVLRDYDDPAVIVPVDLMAAFGPGIGEARCLQSADDFPYRQVRARGSRGGQPERSHQRSGGQVPGWVVDLFQVEFDSLREIDKRLVNRLALAGNVNFQALRDVPILFAVQGRGQGARRLLHPPSVAVLPRAVANRRGAPTGLRR